MESGQPDTGAPSDLTDVRVVRAPRSEQGHEVPGLLRAMASELEDGAIWIALDMSKVATLDSSELGAMLQVLKLVRRRGGDLRLFALRDVVSRLMDLIGLDILCFATEQEAIDSYRT